VLTAFLVKLENMCFSLTKLYLIGYEADNRF